MPFYRNIKTGEEWGRRTIERLLELRKQLEAEVPERRLKETLLLASWNIREFDSHKYGRRMDEAIYYMAEIVDRFDLVAVQEVHKDLEGVKRLMEVLGGGWKYIFTDVTLGERGNMERLAFLYDSDKVRFGGLAGELVLPDVEVGGEKKPVTQLARTPFVCGFTAGWTKFMLATVHILWGKDKADPPERVEEIKQVAQRFREMTLDEDAWARNLMLLGDFNIFRPENATFKEIEKAGFTVPDEIRNRPTNAMKTRHYDQIAFMTRPDSLETTGKAGAFDFYQTVYRTSDEEAYGLDMGEAYEKDEKGKPRTDAGKRTYYSNWRTHQMSDHLPLWVELKIDYSDEYLERLRGPPP